MSENNAKNSDIHHQSDSYENDYDDDDELVKFQYDSKEISFHYSQLCKYSKLIRKKYLIDDLPNFFPQKLHEFQISSTIDLENIYLFFQLLNEDFNIEKSLKLSYKQYIDLNKISEFLQIQKLPKKLFNFNKNHSFDVDFILETILYETENQKKSQNQQFQFTQQMEEALTKQIQICIQNDKFSKLPIHLIYRILDKSDKNLIQSDHLYNIIKISIEKFCPLFEFLDVKNLSDENFNDLYRTFSNENDRSKGYFKYLGCNLQYIMELKENTKNLQKRLNDSQSQNKSIKQEKCQLEISLNGCKKEVEKLQIHLNDLELEKSKIQDQLNSSQKVISSIEHEKSQMKQRLDSLQKEKDSIEQEKNQMKQRLDSLQKEKDSIEHEKSQMKLRIDELQNKENQLRNELKDLKCGIKGTIVTKVKNGLLFNAQINLVEGNEKLDKTKSKYIMSTSNEKKLGQNAYDKGEQISSLNQETITFGGKAGTYYVRALVVDSDGKSCEIVSNPVVLSGECMKFDYEGRTNQVVLDKGRYKLEVWGAKGGDFAGSRSDGNGGKGGLGGYSRGTLNLSEKTKLFIVVGGAGRSANSENGSDTQGSFPDGGGTKTGHCRNRYTSVPGTGGGSTSVRISSDSLYSRVIVAGGGGGAGGSAYETNDGGFGGGSSGGNSHCGSYLQNQGAGTQTGSTPGPAGSGPQGVAGTFGQGATGLYDDGCDSGGGGGGGWYGGGSGGHGKATTCSSGGGGSGWIYTESSFKNWESGDSQNATKFTLKPPYYLTDATTKEGNSSFPSPNGTNNETGHNGNGFAKITPE